MRTIEQRVQAWNIRAEVRWVDSNPLMTDMPAGSRHYRVTLRHRGKQMTVPFSQGPAIEREPTAAEVLECLATDAATLDNSSGFREWCNECGYSHFDITREKVQKIWQACLKQRGQLMTLLGDHRYEKLLDYTEFD
jgi:hypothetical protein